METIKREPLAFIGLLVSLLIGVVSSPILYDWYKGSDITVSVDYSMQEDGRCTPTIVEIKNRGNIVGTGIRFYFEFDHFSQGDGISSYYSGNEPFFGVQPNIDYKNKPGHILIPSLPPEVSQKFIFGESVSDRDLLQKRRVQIANKNPLVTEFPKVLLVTSDQGEADLSVNRQNCAKGA